jgi:hypothetical protein
MRKTYRLIAILNLLAARMTRQGCEQQSFHLFGSNDEDDGASTGGPRSAGRARATLGAGARGGSPEFVVYVGEDVYSGDPIGIGNKAAGWGVDEAHLLLSE